MTTKWGIWASVSGGITGSRQSWCKRGDDVELFASEQEAILAAKQYQEKTSLKGGYTPSGRPIAYATYVARKF